MPEHAKAYNATMATRNFGHRSVRVVNISYGIDIIGSDAESAERTAFYPVAYDGSSFAITLAFMDWAEREAFSTWLRGYMEKTIRGHGFYASMTVNCPARDFVRVGIPEDQLEYGEGLTDVGYQVTLNFLGVTDPTDPNKTVLTSGVAYFKWPKKDKTTRYFYPASKQLAGAASLEGTIFDTTPDSFGGATTGDEISGAADGTLGTTPGNATVADQ